jgi:hypothetical protein
MAMNINSLALPPQTEEQKKQQREKITKLMLNPTQEAEKELIGASSCQHLFKYVSPIEKELELQREKRKKQEQLLSQSLEYQQRQRENHKQMRIDEQVEAMRKFEAEKQQVNIDAGKGNHKNKKIKGETDRQRTLHFMEWVNLNKYDGKQTNYFLQAELRQSKPELWGKNEETFNKWWQTSEAKPAKELLNKLKLEARQAV